MERIILPSCGESESLGIENIKMERCESPSDEDCVARSLDNQPSFSSLGYVKAEVDDFDAPPAPSSDMKHSDYHDNDSILKQLLEKRGKIWNSDTIENSQSEHAVSNLNIKLEGDEIDGIIEQSHSEETKSVIEDTKIFTHQLLAEDMICKTENSSPTEDCVFCSTKKKVPENLRTDDNDVSEASDCKCRQLELNATNGSNTNCQIINMYEYTATENIKLQTDTETPMETKCHLCSYTAEYELDLRQHFDSAHLEAKRHKCKVCDYVTLKKGSLEEHVNVVHQMEIYKCEKCDYTSIQKNNVKQHMNTVHSKVKHLECRLCDYATYSRTNLNTHVSGVHLNERNHKCRMCDYTALHRAVVERHISSVHLKLKNHRCKFCDYTAAGKDTLKRHINGVHLKERTHKCHLCDFSSVLKGTLRSHIESIHLKVKNNKCHMCEYTTCRKENLKVHVNAVHLKVKNHKCDICDFATALRGSLKLHIDNVHLKLKNYKCDICDFAASQNVGLKRHIVKFHTPKLEKS